MRKSFTALAGVAHRAIPAFGIAALLAGCMDQPSRMSTGAPLTGAVGTEEVMAGSVATSNLIRDLQSRNSVLPAGGPFSVIAEQVLAASKGAAAAELRVAQLKAEAQSKNWLPQIGPTVSLSSLSGLVAGLALTQPLLDNGRRKAERDFAAADVEVAASPEKWPARVARISVCFAFCA
jgi:adhesin transport system outer membrane protein